MEQKCNKCQSEWKSNITSAKCPFCGADMQEKKQHDLTTPEGVVAHIVDSYGTEVLKQPTKFYSLFTDFAHDMEKELRVLKVGLNAGIHDLFTGADKTDGSAKTVAKKKAISKLTDDYMINPDWAEKVVFWFAYALWGDEEKTSAPQTEQTTPPDVQNTETAEDLYQKGERAYLFDDYATAVTLYRQAAEQGHAQAQNALAWCYAENKGIEQNYSEAVHWYRKAAEQGNAKGQFNLGCCYFRGEGVSESESEAVEWFKKAAEQGHAKAQFNLGRCYLYGWGVSEDDYEAVEWFEKAAEQGHAKAQCDLGRCYLNGWGVSEDDYEAVEWFEKAAKQGYAEAQFELGRCYFNGWGVLFELKEKGIELFEKAAEQGYAEAQSCLGSCYFSGDGVSQSYIEAAMWYQKAQANGMDCSAKLEDCYRNGAPRP